MSGKIGYRQRWALNHLYCQGGILAVEGRIETISDMGFTNKMAESLIKHGVIEKIEIEVPGPGSSKKTIEVYAITDRGRQYILEHYRY